MGTIELYEIKRRYQSSVYRDDDKVKRMDDFDFCSLIYQLKLCQKLIYSDKRFKRDYGYSQLPIIVQRFVYSIGRDTIEDILIN